MIGLGLVPQHYGCRSGVRTSGPEHPDRRNWKAAGVIERDTSGIDIPSLLCLKSAECPLKASSQRSWLASGLEPLDQQLSLWLPGRKRGRKAAELTKRQTMQGSGNWLTESGSAQGDHSGHDCARTLDLVV